MNQIQKILKISAKESFIQLRKNSPYFCHSMQKEIYITRKFWNHINFSKYRPQKDIILKLALLPLIENILLKGELVEKRDWGQKNSYRIERKIKEEICILILEQRNKKNIYLLSCFVHQPKKNDLSRPLMGTQA